MRKSPADATENGHHNKESDGDRLVRPIDIIDDILHEMMVEGPRLDRLAERYSKARDARERQPIIREYYESVSSEIMETARTNIHQFVNKHVFNWRFNPNERYVWESIGMRPIVLYPEFPVMQYFLDFGHPLLKIGVEADGKKFHDTTEARKRDKIRDRNLAKAGWTIFRATWDETSVEVLDLADIAEKVAEGDSTAEEELEKWMFNSADGLVDAIEFFYFMSDSSRARRRKRLPSYEHLASDTLRLHMSVEMPLPKLDRPLS